MSCIDETLATYMDDMKSVESWCNDLYQDRFSSFFEEIRGLYEQLADKQDKISDAVLESILTDTPLALFTVSERLTALRTNREVGKLKMREREADIRKELIRMLDEHGKDCGFSKSDIPSLIKDSIINDQIVIIALDGVINRVENEISFSRELIMSAKKIWDRRKNTENVNPIGPVVPEYKELPDYDEFKSADF